MVESLGLVVGFPQQLDSFGATQIAAYMMLLQETNTLMHVARFGMCVSTGRGEYMYYIWEYFHSESNIFPETGNCTETSVFSFLGRKRRLQNVAINMDVNQHGYFSLSIGLVLLAILAASVRVLFWKQKGTKSPPMLRDTIPYMTNTYQYFAHMNKFLTRATSALQTNKIFGFHLGPKTVFFITGQQNIQTLFRSSPNIGFEYFMLTVIEVLWRATPEDLAKFRDDKSGRAATPAPGTENTPKAKRYWYNLHTVMQKYLEQKYHSDVLSRTYQRFFAEGQLTQRPVGEWTEIHVVRFLKNEMARAATASMVGTRILEVVPNLIDLVWAYDKEIGNLLYGPPRWLFPRAHAAQRRLLDATGRYYKEEAFASFDLNGPDSEADWEPIFGSRWSREMAKWMIDCGFHPDTCPGIIASTAIVAWVLTVSLLVTAKIRVERLT